MSAAPGLSLQASPKLSFMEKFGYSLGDGAAQFVYLSIVNFQSQFYTDAAGIDPAWTGWLLMLTRLWDAFFDPVMGYIADRTKTRWGRFRPWILWSAIPWGVLMILAFMVPPLKSMQATFLYALVTNVALWTVYSMNNTPYSALTAVMTGDQKERTKLSQYRFITAMVAQLIVGGFTLALMNEFGGPLPKVPTTEAVAQLAAMTQPATVPTTVISVGTTQPGTGALTPGVAGDPLAKPTEVKPAVVTINDTPAMKEYRRLKQEHDARGWPRTMALYAGICVVLFMVCFLTVRERLEPVQKHAAPIGLSFSLIAKNGPWLVMFIVCVTHYILSALRGSAYSYYFQYVLDRDALQAFVAQWPLPVIDAKADPNTLSMWFKFLKASKLTVANDGTAYITAYGLLQMTNKLWTVAGIIAASGLIAMFSKKTVVALSLSVNALFIVGLYFVPINNIWGVFIVEWMGQLAYAPTVPLLWVLFADVCDYTEWKSGIGITGFIYATFFFGLKAGLSIGGLVGGKVLAMFGYVPNAPVQTPEGKHGIILMATLIPGAIALAGGIAMLFYQITKKMNNDIADTLHERRRAARAGEPPSS